MIAKAIPKDPAIRDSFGALARYIAAAGQATSDPGTEKLDDFWMVNMDAGADLEALDIAILEVESIQALNTRAGPSRTYHLMVSFAPGETPPQEALRDMERAFADALGYGDHQRVVGVHVNTDQTHFHVAFNRIHPETLRAHTPWNDYRALEKTARAMERQYGLYVTKGMSDYEAGENRLSPGARRFEAMTWQRSFQNHVLDHRAALVADAARAADWRSLHAVADAHGLALVPRGNGLVFINDGPDAKGEAIKASHVSCALARGALEARLGPYEKKAGDAEGNDDRKTRRAAPGTRRVYGAAPLTRHPSQAGPWRRYVGASPATLRRDSVLGQAYKTWKEFLYADALGDPMAMAIIYTHRRMLNALAGAFDRTPPRTLAPALNTWLTGTDWLPSQDGLSAWFGEGPAGFGETAGLKTDAAGRLFLPLRDAGGAIQAVQVIDAKGRRAVVGAAARGDLMHMVDPTRKLAGGPLARGASTGDDGPYDGPIIVAADPKRAAEIANALRCPVAVPHRLEDSGGVLTALRRAHPRARLALAVDAADADRYETRAWHGRRARTGAAVVTLPGADADTVSDAKATPRRADALRHAFTGITGDHAFARWHDAADWATPETAPALAALGVRGFGVKRDADGAVLIPLRDIHGRVRDVAVLEETTEETVTESPHAPSAPAPSLGDAAPDASPDPQAVQSGPTAPNAPDPDAPVLMHVIDPARRIGEDRILLTVGYAEASAIHQAARVPTVMVRAPGDLQAAAEALSVRYPDAAVVIAAAGEESDAAARAAEQARAAVFTAPDTPSFTTALREEGFVALRRRIAEAAGDDAFRLWDEAAYARDAPGPGLKEELGIKQAPNDSPEETAEPSGEALQARRWLLPGYDAVGRLAAVQILDDTLAVLERVGNSPDASPALHTVRAPRTRDAPVARGDAASPTPESRPPLLLAGDYETALALNRALDQDVTTVLDGRQLAEAAASLQRRDPDRPIVITAEAGTAETLREAIQARAPKPKSDDSIAPAVTVIEPCDVLGDGTGEAAPFKELATRPETRDAIRDRLRDVLARAAPAEGDADAKAPSDLPSDTPQI